MTSAPPPADCARFPLSRKVLVFGGLCIAAIFGAYFLLFDPLLESAFQEVERDLAVQRIERVVWQIDQTARQQSYLLLDNANWNDSFEFLAGRLPEHIADNFSPGTSTSNQDFVAFFDKNHHPVATSVLMPVQVPAGLADGAALVRAGLLEEGKAASAFIGGGDGLWLVSARPVLRSDGSGDSPGWLLFGRKLDDNFIEETAVNCGVTLKPLSSLSATPPGFPELSFFTATQRLGMCKVFGSADNPEGNGPLVLAVAFEETVGFPQAILQVEIPTSVFASANALRDRLAIGLLVAGCSITLAGLVLIEIFIARRVRQLDNDLRTLARNPDSAGLLDEAGDDEFAILARSANRLITNARERAAEAVRANKEKSDFVATITHDIRSPLNGILGFAEILRHEPLTKSQSEMLDQIERCGKTILSLAGNVLDLSRIEAGKIEVTEMRFNPADLVGEVLAPLRLEAEKKNLYLESTTGKDVPLHVFSDPGRLRQILTNLAGNAVKFTATGGVTVSVATAPASALEFEVRDTGPGLSEDARSDLFRPFEQGGADVYSRHGGSGLGLYICRRLVDALGGKIEVESTPGLGATFRVRIPYRPAA